MENKYTKPQYKCAICGTAHDELKSRINCETACLKKQENEAKKAAELKKKQEHDECKAFTDAQVKEAAQAVREYTSKYGLYTYDYEEDLMYDNGACSLFSIIKFLNSMEG